MSAIRPDLPSFTQGVPPSRDTAAREAQAAFFRAALGTTDAPAAHSLAAGIPSAAAPLAGAPMAGAVSAAAGAPLRAAGATAPATTSPQGTGPAEPGQYLRPGSYLDISI